MNNNQSEHLVTATCPACDRLVAASLPIHVHDRAETVDEWNKKGWIVDDTYLEMGQTLVVPGHAKECPF